MRKHSYLAFFITSYFLIFYSAVSGLAHTQITIAFRFDDLSEVSNIVFERKVADLFKKHRFPLTVGVIPFAEGQVEGQAVIYPLSTQKGRFLKEYSDLGIFDVALHGLNHKIRKNGEFAGLECSEQKDMLLKGRQHLAEMTGIEITTFIPPWNKNDLNTLKALEELSFKCISADEHTPANPSSTLSFIPATCNLSELRQAIESSRSLGTEHPVIVVLFHSEDFIEVDKDYASMSLSNLERLLNWIAAHDDIQVMSISNITDSRTCSAERYAAWKQTMFFPRLPQFHHFFTESIFFSQSGCQKVRATNLIVFLSILSAVFLTSFAFGKIIRVRSKFFFLLANIGVFLSACFLVIYDMKNGQLSPKLFGCLIILLSALMGLIVSYLWLRRKHEPAASR